MRTQRLEHTSAAAIIAVSDLRTTWARGRTAGVATKPDAQAAARATMVKRIWPPSVSSADLTRSSHRGFWESRQVTGKRDSAGTPRGIRLKSASDRLRA